MNIRRHEREWRERRNEETTWEMEWNRRAIGKGVKEREWRMGNGVQGSDKHELESEK